MYESMALAGATALGGRRHKTRRGGGYYGAGGINPSDLPSYAGGRRTTRRAQLKGMSVGTLRKMLKKIGRKTTGTKATLVKRLNYAPMKGGDLGATAGVWDGGFDSHGDDGRNYLQTVQRA